MARQQIELISQDLNRLISTVLRFCSANIIKDKIDSAQVHLVVTIDYREKKLGQAAFPI